MHKEDSYIMKFLNHIFNKHRVPAVLVLSFFAILLLIRLFSTSFAVSTPPNYDPGATLDPAEGPGTAVVVLPTSQWTTTGSDIYYNTGFVGIGEVTPQAKLHLKGSSDNTQLIIQANSTQSNTNPLINLWDSTGNSLMWINSDNANNIFIGENSGAVNNAIGGGTFNVFVGRNAGQLNTTGEHNAAFGTNALLTNSTGDFNTALGISALQSNTANNNTAVGHNALTNNSSGESNVAVGSGTLILNTMGGFNTANGSSALGSNTEGSSNTAYGSGALSNNTTGSTNTVYGTDTLQSNIAGNYNTALGSGAGNASIGDSNVFIGYQAGFNETGSNKFYIANNGGTPLIYGDFATGFVGIGTATLTLANKLDVGGSLAVGAAYAGITAAPVNGAIIEGFVGIGMVSPTSPLQVAGLPVYANNAAADSGGLSVGAFYRTGGDPDLVAVVH